MSNIKKALLSFGVIFLMIFSTYTFADVGDFESYDSSWDSDWGYDSSWNSDWDYDYSWGSNYGYSGSSSSYGGGIISVIIFVIVVLAIIIGSKNDKAVSAPNRNYPNVNRNRAPINPNGYVRNIQRSEAVADEVRRKDKYFNDEKFLAWVKNLFVKLQTAWSERNFEEIRVLESEDLFEQHSRQLSGYVNRKQINKLERICVNFAELVTFAQDNEKDILVVALNSSMLDYIVDEATGRVLKGSKDNRLTNTYKLTFIRKKGNITEEGTDKLKTTNCPNCGAPTKITSSGKCEFCGSVITIGTHDWVLGDMERY